MIQFEGHIKQGGMGGAYVEFPFDTVEVFGKKGRIPIKCTFDGIPYRGSLVKMKTPCHILIILKAIREQLNKGVGDVVQVELELDDTPRTVEVHPLLLGEFKKDGKLKTAYEKLSFTNQKEIFKSLDGAKREETKLRRLEKILGDLKS